MYNPFSLTDKTVFVSGASSGIGKSIAIECSKMGARLFITGRNVKRLDETFKQLEGNGHFQLVADLTAQDGIDYLAENLPSLDGIVHCAGIAKLLPFQFTNKEILEEVVAINFKSHLILSQFLLKKKKINKFIRDK